MGLDGEKVFSPAKMIRRRSTFSEEKDLFHSNGTGVCRLCLRLKSLISIINALTQNRVILGFFTFPWRGDNHQNT